MKRIFAIILAAMLLLSLAACTPAEPSGGQTNDETFVVGVCQLIKHDALDAATKGFIDTLKAEFGDKVEIIDKVATGDMNSCTPIISDFVSKDVDLIMANATPALQAAAAATEDIPILGTSVTEYGVALDLENFNGTVGTNVSGTSDLAPLDEQAAMITEWFPNAKTVGLLYCSAEANSIYQVEKVKGYLEEKNITATLYAFSDTNDLQAVANKAASESDVVYVPTDNAAAAATETIYGVCVDDLGKPIIAGEEGICKGCGVATLSISYYDLGVTTAKMAIKILKGEAEVSEMPIEYAPPTKKYNATICQELELTALDGYVAIEE